MATDTRARWSVRLVAAWTLLVALTASLSAGVPYVWCAPMQQVMLRPCCPEEHDHPAGLLRAAPAEDRADAPRCCEHRRLEGASPAVRSEAAPVPETQWVSLATAPWAPSSRGPVARAGGLALRVRTRAHPPRAGPRAPLHLLHCALRC